MFQQLGIVTNIWTKRLKRGDQFEDLIAQFSAHGFRHMEVRDGEYLRNSPFGHFIQEIERAMTRYTDAQWKEICDIQWRDGDGDKLIREEDQELFVRVRHFIGKIKYLVLSYAMTYPWLSPPVDMEEDNQRIIQAKKLAYLLCPHQARLRVVDLTSTGEYSPPLAIANLQRYRSLLPSYPVVFAIENSESQPATVTLDLAVQGGVKLTYDEANTYRLDGTPLNEPEAFWKAVSMETLTSVHFKQKTAEGVLARVGEGFVNFAAIAQRLHAQEYAGDLLLENKPTDQPLEDAIQSREYLLGCES